MTEVNFNEYTTEELKKLQANIRTYMREHKDAIKKQAKANREINNEKRDAYGRHFVNPGKMVTVMHKGKRQTGRVTKVTPKTFHIDLIIDGKLVNTWRKFSQVFNPELDSE